MCYLLRYSTVWRAELDFEVAFYDPWLSPGHYFIVCLSYIYDHILYICTSTRTYYIVMGTGCEATCTCVYAISYANRLAMAEPRPQLQLHCDRHSRYSRIIHMQMSDILTGFSFNLFDKVYRRRFATLCNTLGNYVRLACTSSRQKVSVIIDKCDTNTNIIYSILTVSN